MAELHLDRRQYLEFEKLGVGAFAPLTGFMTHDAFASVVSDMRLPDGSVFPLPVILDVSNNDAARLRGRPRVALVHADRQVGWLFPEDVFTCDRLDAATHLFGTSEVAHPGVDVFCQMRESFIGGRVELTERVHDAVSGYDLTPAETRALFTSRGWKTVAGFQTRNVPHRAHEYLQRVALEHVDGLFIQPLVGYRRAGDYTPEAILAGYEALIAGFYRLDRVLLGVLTTWMRYAGPREALFHAIVRRNYGCTHFVIGRDHAGVGSYYGKYEAHALVRRFESELGITPLCLHGPYHCALCDGIVTEHTCPHLTSRPGAVTEISGTRIRAMLSAEAPPDPRMIRPEIIASLRGVPLFIAPKVEA